MLIGPHLARLGFAWVLCLPYWVFFRNIPQLRQLNTPTCLLYLVCAATQACALLTSNVTPAFAHLYRVATLPQDAPKPTDLTTRVRTAALIREAALKSTIFVGVPRVRPGPNSLLVRRGRLTPRQSQVILSLAAFHGALEDDVKPELRLETHPDRYAVLRSLCLCCGSPSSLKASQRGRDGARTGAVAEHLCSTRREARRQARKLSPRFHR